MFIFGKEKKVDKVNKEIERLKQQKEAIQQEINDLKQEKVEVSKEIDSCRETLAGIESEISNGRQMQYTIDGMEEYGIPYYGDSLDELEHRRFELQQELMFCYSMGLWKVISKYTLNGSYPQGQALQSTFGDSIMYAFNAYLDKKEKALTPSNLEKSKEQVKNKFNTFQRKAERVGIALNSKYATARMNMMDINLAIKVKQKEERQQLREEKRKMREQEQLIAEAEREKKRLEAERKNLTTLFSQTVTAEERDSIRQRLATIDKRIEDIDWRIEHESAGWLYLATTKAMPGIYKAGCTRQLNPLNRLAQLSSASVPYPFECKGLVYSENVFDLEAKLHRRLDAERVNKDNTHKEFFHGDPADAIEILEKEFGVKVVFADEEWIDEE